MSRLGTMVDKIDERRPGSNLPLLSVSQTRGVLRQSELFDRPPRADSLDAYKVCRRGDIVFNKMSIRAGALGVAQEDGLVTYHYEVLRPRPTADARYIVYLAKSDWFIGELIKRERGIGAGDQANVRTTEVPFRVFRTIKAHLPDLSAQRAIADYLDHETTQIDTLIEEQQRLVVLARERSRSQIAHQVDGWNLVPLRRGIAELRQGWSPNCEPWATDGVTEWAVLKVGCSNTGTFSPAENKRLPDDQTPRADLTVRRGEVIMSRANTKDLVGAAAVVEGDYPRLMLSDLNYGLTTNHLIDPRFLAISINSGLVRHQISAASKGTSHSMQKIPQRDIRELLVPMPPLEHQRDIVAQVRRLKDGVASLVRETEQFIELSRERRAALITAAVTGQINVGAVA